VVAAAVLLLAGRSSAQDAAAARPAETGPADTRPAATQPAARVTVGVVTEEGQRLVRAAVAADGKPLENATVSFHVRRTFGDLLLGQDKTLDDGTAAVPFPASLPGGKTGELVLVAEVTAPAEYAGACAELTAAGGRVVAAADDPFPRALWAPHAPLPLLVVIASLVAAVWTTYAFVISQVLAIRKGARS
jgi:hypothetical protein